MMIDAYFLLSQRKKAGTPIFAKSWKSFQISPTASQ